MIPKDSSMYSAVTDERNACAVRALSVAANMPYEIARRLYAKHGRKPNDGAYRFTTRAVMDELDYQPVAHFAPVLCRAVFITLAQFIKAHPRGRYWLGRKGHAFALIDGVVHDWAWGGSARCRITAAYRINQLYSDR